MAEERQINTKRWVIYKHTNKINNKAYIGITTKKPAYRWNNGRGYSTQKIFANAIKKYGWENFSHEILESNIKTIEEANQKEKYYIAKYHTWLGDKNCMGYNKTPGGDSKLGKSYSKEGRLKLSLARKGKPKTELHKLHISQGNRGKVRTAETKAKISKSKKGKASKRTRESFIKAATKRPIKCNENNTTYISISEASRALNLSASGIHAQLSGKQKTVKGFTFTDIK